METITRQHLNIRDAKAVASEINLTLERIDAFVKKNDYAYKTNDKQSNIDSLETALNDESLKKKKVLRRYMHKIQHSPSLFNINKFFHLLHKVILKSDHRTSIVTGELESLIQAKKQAYKAALQIARAARHDYKTTKGDFYKKRLK